MRVEPHLFGLVNPGCPKNTVDSEHLLAEMARAGYRFVADPAAADVCLVNTCGFLDAARREAAAVLRELGARRAAERRPLLVATGCLVERIGGAPELADFLRTADARVGFADYARLPAICAGLLRASSAGPKPARGQAGRRLPGSYLRWLDGPRMRIGPVASAFLKLGEGCSNNCAYCSIPLIRGRQASRPPAAILTEARELVAAGAKELNLIAQDTTAYGMDVAGAPRLAALLRALFRMPDDVWFRVLYAHPRHLTAEMLATLASDPRVCPYLDLPLQHVSEAVLQAMARGYGRRRVDEVLAQIRRHLPGAALRTTFIAGHPGESDRDFEELLAFVGEGHFDHVGVFAWSPEPGTAAAEMAGRVPSRVAAERRARLLAAQAKVSAAKWRARGGRATTLLLERPERAGWRGRTVWQAPEVDGETILAGRAPGERVGDRVSVEIVRTSRYDCRARRKQA